MAATHSSIISVIIGRNRRPFIKTFLPGLLINSRPEIPPVSIKACLALALAQGTLGAFLQQQRDESLGAIQALQFRISCT